MSSYGAWTRHVAPNYLRRYSTICIPVRDKGQIQPGSIGKPVGIDPGRFQQICRHGEEEGEQKQQLAWKEEDKDEGEDEQAT
ncbi:hypothetical protein BHM03_00030852 [Ensete ventricosum]|nr:hypothetical protein BHM03_00030852 [Ensete ventricosum]